MRKALVILPFALLVATSCDIRPSSDGHDMVRFKAGNDEYFRAFPKHAEDIYFIQEGLQSGREHVTFFASRADVDQFIRENTKGMAVDHGSKIAHAPRPDNEHWPNQYDHVSRSYIYKRYEPGPLPFWVGIFVRDERRGSRVWAFSDLM